MENFSYIKDNYLSLLEEIDKISSRVGVPTPTLVSVTKSGSDEELLALAEAGALDFGENRPGEVRRRTDILKAAGYNPKMHEIGTLQRNKIKLIASDVYMIHSIDSLKLAEDVNRIAGALQRKIPVLIEINSAAEEQKGGILPSMAEKFYEEIAPLPNIEISGIMTMGPLSDNPEELRPYFRETKKLFDKLVCRYTLSDNPILSMGMSDSYEVAIEEGSTLVRVGRKLFRK
jgi:pyridoxal phosphate enzyme (YggS family)